LAKFRSLRSWYPQRSKYKCNPHTRSQLSLLKYFTKLFPDKSSQVPEARIKCLSYSNALSSGLDSRFAPLTSHEMIIWLIWSICSIRHCWGYWWKWRSNPTKAGPRASKSGTGLKAEGIPSDRLTVRWTSSRISCHVIKLWMIDSSQSFYHWNEITSHWKHKPLERFLTMNGSDTFTNSRKSSISKIYSIRVSTEFYRNNIILFMYAIDFFVFRNCAVENRVIQDLRRKCLTQDEYESSIVWSESTCPSPVWWRWAELVSTKLVYYPT
jgi:hypothetical protein